MLELVEGEKKKKKKAELLDFVTVLRLPPVSERSAEVSTTPPSRSVRVTCARLHIHSYKLYKVPVVVMETPYPELEGEMLCAKKMPW